MAYTFSNELVSDLHKDAFGHRPDADFWDMWNNGLSDEGRQAEWDYMVKVLKQELEEEKIREQYAVERFEEKLSILIDNHNLSEDAALRYMTTNEHFETSQDIEHWVWGLGILFTDRGRDVVKKLKTIIKTEY